MNQITGLTDQPNQQTTIVLSGGTKAILSLEYRPQQLGWFYDLNWNGTDIVLGQRLVAAPNILRQYINRIPFGLSVITADNVEPTQQTDLEDGTASIYLLEGTDLTDIESQVYGAPAEPTPPTVTTPAGTDVVIAPTSWGPATGDLGGSYPDPIVRAVHEQGGAQLALASVPDGQFLKRVGNTLVGAPSVGGNVTGPGSSTAGHAAVFADATGQVIADGGTLGSAAAHAATDFDAAGAAAAAQSAAQASSAQRASNLSDLSNAATARVNLGLGTAATYDVPASGNASPTQVVLGNDSRLTGGASGNLPAGGTKFQRLAKNSPTNYDASWYGPDWFNVKDYGAVGDGSTDDTTSIQAAVTAALASAGTAYNPVCTVVFFPYGTYKTTAAITGAWSDNAVTFLGLGGATIKQFAALANGFTFDLSGGSYRQDNQITVDGINFITSSSVQAGTALDISYGTTNISSTSQFPGPRIRNCNFGMNDPSALGGWTNGIKLTNCWLANLSNLFSYGNGTHWASASSPGAGDGGAGSGYFIGAFSGTNFTISNVQGHFWGQGIRLAPVNGSSSTQWQLAQGVLINLINFVECWEGIHTYGNSNGDSYDFLTLTNFQFDLGNVSIATHRCMYLEFLGNGMIAQGLCLQNNGGPIIELSNSAGTSVNDVQFQGFTNIPSGALVLSGTSNGCKSRGCDFGGMAVTIGSSSGLGSFSNTYTGGTITDSGNSNHVGDPRHLPVVVTPTATTTFSFTVNISSAGLGKAPTFVSAQVETSLPNDYIVTMDYSHAGNSATSVNMLMFRAGGGTLANSPIRLGVNVNPP